MSAPWRADMLWAACVIAHGLADRADAAAAGGFGTMSALCADLLALDQQGTDLVRLSRELGARGVRVSVLDPFLAWYPGWRPAPGSGPHLESQNIDEETVLRFADAVGAESMTVLTPFSGATAPLPAVVDALGRFGDRAGTRGLRLHLEVIPTSRAPDLATGWEIVRRVDRDNIGLVLDLFHLARARTDLALLRSVPAEKIFHVQLCDGSLVPRVPDYFEEAVTFRDFAGEGELPVRELAQCLADMGALGHVGPEVFSPGLARLPAAEAGRVCRAKTDAFLATVTP
ncbi:MAG: sugar phosphate isomerase/epimerase family protein [Trebonia sp.]